MTRSRMIAFVLAVVLTTHICTGADVATTRTPAPTPVPATRASQAQPLRPARPGDDPVVTQLRRIGPLLATRGVIDGVDVGWFVVDTGASGILVDSSIAEKLQRKPVGKTRSSAVGGLVDAEIYRCDRFEIAGCVADDAVLLAVGVRQLANLVGVEIAGLLGGDVLAAMPFALDMREETLTFYPSGDAAPRPATQPHDIRLVKNCPAVRATLEGRPAWFEIDTGARGDVYANGAFLGLFHDLLDGKRPVSALAFGLGGRQESYDVRLSSVALLGRTFDDVEVTYTTAPEHVAADRMYVAGRIGTGLLRDARLTFDYDREQLWVEWREPEPVDAFIKRAKERAARSLIKETALMVAASRGRADAVLALLAERADVNAADASGFTALTDAAGSDSPGAEECARLLIKAGADVNHQAAVMGLAPLHYAALRGKLATVKDLLAKKAKVNVATTLGQTALLRAAEAGWIDVARALLDAGGDTKLARKTGETPLMLAAEHGDLEMITLLLERGGADVNQKGPESATALAYAVRGGKPDAVELLLACGATVNIPYAPSTPLHVAATAGNERIVSLLLAAGADSSAKDREGKTPIDRAAAAGRRTILRLLLDHKPQETTRPAT